MPQFPYQLNGFNKNATAQGRYAIKMLLFSLYITWQLVPHSMQILKWMRLWIRANATHGLWGQMCRCEKSEDARSQAWKSSGAVLVPKKPAVGLPFPGTTFLEWAQTWGWRLEKCQPFWNRDITILVGPVFTFLKALSHPEDSHVALLICEYHIGRAWCLSIHLSIPYRHMYFFISGSTLFPMPGYYVLTLMALSTLQPIENQRHVIGITLSSPIH